jgi:DNA mismatch endonuclease (patch repair protein)
MQRTRRRDTPAELALRQELHGRGLRYRVDFAPLPGLRRRADVVFPRLKIAVFCDGCFWHGCPRHVTWPKKNRKWWQQKIETNRRRDIDTTAQLQAAGWLVLRSWEHEDVQAVADLVVTAVAERRRLCTKPG